MDTRRVAHLPHFGRLSIKKVGAGWFTSIMGTGILAICVTISPVPIPMGPALGIVLWSVDTVLFAVFAALLIASTIRAPRELASTFNDPAKAQLWGAPPMAAFTIAVGFLKIGATFLNPAICLAAAQMLFVIGVLGSIFSAFAVPYLMFTHHELSTEKTFGSWLLPVVPPIVASVPAALLAQSWPEAIRGDMLALAYALLGIGIILAAIIIVMFYGRLVYHNVPDAPLVPTMWIVVGPLGQSVAGMIALGSASRAVWPELGHGLQMAGLAYGVLVWGFAVYWITMAIAMTVRAARKHLPFTLGWWAFTFPVGTLTAGTDALYGLTHAHIFAIASVAFLGLLATMWMLVASKSIGGAILALRVDAQSRFVPLQTAIAKA